MSSRKHHAASDATTPTTAARASSPTNRLLRTIDAGSSGEAAVSAMSFARAPGLERTYPALWSVWEMNERVHGLSPFETAGTLAAMPEADSAPGSALPAGPPSAAAEAAAG